MENVKEAVADVLEVMREQGKRTEANIRILDVPVWTKTLKGLAVRAAADCFCGRP